MLTKIGWVAFSKTINHLSNTPALYLLISSQGTPREAKIAHKKAKQWQDQSRPRSCWPLACRPARWPRTRRIYTNSFSLGSNRLANKLIFYDLCGSGVNCRADPSGDSMLRFLRAFPKKLPLFASAFMHQVRWIFRVNLGKQESTIGIVGGQIALKVQKLLPTQSVQVKSDAAVMGVRGTSFTVTAP